MHYWEWGAADNPRVLVCVHGLTRAGIDFAHLAESLSGAYRVVCPDVVGRGGSDWLPDPMLYGLPQYALDMTALLARLDVEQVDWLGTSMGGLIGLTLAGQPNSPIRRLILNDVGPRLEPEALARIGDYVGKPMRFKDLDAATEYLRSISAGFGLKAPQQWREFTEAVVRPDGAEWIFHYDPAIGVPLRAMTPEAAAQGEQQLWRLYEAIRGPVLLIRGRSRTCWRRPPPPG